MEIIQLENGDRTVVCNQPIRNEEPLVILSKDIDYSTEWARNYGTVSTTGLPDDLLIAAALYQFHTSLVKESKEADGYYFLSLPTAQWYKTNHLTLKLYNSLSEEKQNALESDFDLFRRFNTLKEWAKSIPGHRVNVDLVYGSVLQAATRTWPCGLVPYIDFFQHADDGSWLSNDNTTIHATHEYETGSQVNTSYGPKDRLMLMSWYGFESDQPTTISMYREEPSSTAFSLDPDLTKCWDSLGSSPLLLGNQLLYLNELIRWGRMASVTRIDALTITEISDESKEVINLDNEARALRCVLKSIGNKLQLDLQVYNKLKDCGAIAEIFQGELSNRAKCFAKAVKEIETMWADLL